MLKSKSLACLYFFLFFLFLPLNVFADDSEFKIKQGPYIGLSFVHNSIGGDFDDSVLYYSSTHVYNVPDIDTGSGFGVTFGYKYDKFGWELGYQRTYHDTHTIFVDVGDQDAVYNLIDFNLKIDVLAKKRLRPNIIFGFGYAWLDVENNASDGVTLSDLKFSGWAGNLGAGIAYYITPQLSINGSFIYRWQIFTDIEGENLDEDLTGNGPNFSLGIAYTF